MSVLLVPNRLMRASTAFTAAATAISVVIDPCKTAATRGIRGSGRNPLRLSSALCACLSITQGLVAINGAAYSHVSTTRNRVPTTAAASVIGTGADYSCEHRGRPSWPLNRGLDEHHDRKRKRNASRSRFISSRLFSGTSSFAGGDQMPASDIPNPGTWATTQKAQRQSQSSTNRPTMTDVPTTWTKHDTTSQQQRCILPLSSDSHKGSSGRIGVVGGSARYTGAPYYAAMASLKVGADLASVFCAEEACIPIKCYSPELMVSSIYSAADFDRLVETNQTESAEADMLVDKMVNEVTSTMNRLHVLIIGPGLGRCPLVFKGVAKIIQAAQSQNIPLVLDADALFMLTQEPYVRTLLCNDAERSVRDGSISGSSSTSTLLPPCVLTPNVVEYKRLMQCTPLGEERWKDMIICKKGATDTIVHKAKGIEYHCEEQGGWKRSGGIGDVLAGTLGTLVAWNRILTQRAARQGHNGVDDASPTSAPQASSTSTLQMAAAGFATADDLPLACWTACCFAKMATKRAYDEHGRAMTAPDVLAELGPTVDAATRI